MTRLYSYERFSTVEQEHGDSLRRQTQKAEAYAEQHGLTLDRQFELQDRGVSAYRGGNFDKGALGQFLKAVDDGLVPRGSLLGAENLDRVTRENPYDAQVLMREIFRRDISLVTYDDHRIYNEETLRNDFTANIMLMVTNHRAHDESKRKAERLRSAWVGKRARVGSRILTERIPGWLRVTPGKKFKVIDARAAVVRRIFEMAVSGIGLEAIARAFNAEGLPTFGKARYWRRSYLLKIIESPAPIGAFIPHTVDYLRDPKVVGKAKRVRRPLDPIEGYFPAVVDAELYTRVQAMRERRAPATRSATVRNVLAGLAVCPTCRGSMTRVSKGKRSKAYLVCAKAKAGAGCKYLAHPYEPIEAAIKSGVRNGSFMATNLSTARSEAMEEMGQVERQIESVVELVLAKEKPPISLRKKLDELEDLKAELQIRLDVMPEPQSVLANIERLRNLVEWNPTEVNALLRQILAKAVVKADGLMLEWKGGDRASFVLLE